jgi:hypothetical protein
MSAPGMSLSERLRELAALLADGEFGDNEASAMLVETAAEIADRLTVDGLAGVIGDADSDWFHSGAKDGRSICIAQAIIDHLTQSQEPQSQEAVSSPPLDGVGGVASRAQEQPSQSGPGAVAPATTSDQFSQRKEP